MKIVLARIEEEQVIVRHGRIDLGERHTFKSVPKAVVCMWLNNGTQKDATKAQAFADKEGYKVFCYEKVGDPLEQARKDILAAVMA